MKLILSQPFVNSVGLLFDIIGAVLIFIYLTPVSDGISQESAKDYTNEEVAKFNKIARFGLVLLIIGFVLQLVSNLI